MMASPRTSKAASVSSAGTTASGSLSFLPRYTPKPEPAYVSAAAAADHVTHHHSHDQFDLLSPATSPTNEFGAHFSEPALKLLNTFLDSLLYNFLAKAHGTSLSQLRPAITEVLKAKLARDALVSADEELHGLIGETDGDVDSDEESAEPTFGGQSSWSQDWHLEMAFKRMRLRVMVFIRLGDFDNEDEDRFLEDDEEFRMNGERAPQAQDINLLASPAAVYLASILEHVAEQALTTAGESAYRRSLSRMNRRSSIHTEKEIEGMDPERVIVQEMDIEKIALNPTLGRLWRTWRKNYRNAYGVGGFTSPSSPSSPTPYRGRLGSLNEIARPPSRATDDRDLHAHELERHLTPDEIPEGDVTETDIAANIPLPMSENDVDEIEILGVAIPLPMSENDVDEIEIIGVAIPLPMTDNDVNEIEVPGLAREINEDEEEKEETIILEETPKRPLSALFGSYLQSSKDSDFTRPALTRQRSNSVPARGRLPFLYYFFAPRAEADEEEPGSAEVSAIAPVEDIEEMPKHDSKDIVPKSVLAAEEPESVEEKALSSVEQEKKMQTTAIEDVEGPIAGKEETTQPTFGKVSAPTTVEEEETAAKEPIQEEEETDHKKEVGVVAGVVAGAAALAGAAYATIAGSGHKAEDMEEPKPAMSPATTPTPRSRADNDIAERIKRAHRLSAKNLHETAKGLESPIEEPLPAKEPAQEPIAVKEPAKESIPFKEVVLRPVPVKEPVMEPRSVSPVETAEVASGPVSAVDDLDKPAIIFPKRSTSYVPTGPIPRANPDEYPETAYPEKEVIQHTRAASTSAPFAQTKPEYASSVSSIGSGYDLGPNRTSVDVGPEGPHADSDVKYMRKSLLPAPLQLVPRDDEEKQVVPQRADEVDEEAIGVARTTNERVQSHSPTPDQQQHRSYYLPGSSKISSPGSRPGSSSRDRSLVGADEYILARQSSASKRNTGPSPLREVTEAEQQPKENGISVLSRDTPHAVPFYHRPVKDEALKEEQVTKRIMPPLEAGNAPKSTTKSRPPPLKTTGAFVTAESEAARPGSSSQSAGGRRSSSSTPSGHSAKGSASSSYMARNGEKRPSDESRRKDFDSLLKEGETVKYTLTPDGLRESDPFRPTSSNNRMSALALSTAGIDRGPPSPRIVSSPTSANRRPSAHDITNPPVSTNRRPSAHDTYTPPVMAVPVTVSVPPKRTGYIPRVSEFRKSFTPRSLTARPEPMNTNARKSGFLPREPRVTTDGTQDFADFMRSTKPTSEAPLVPLVRPTSDSKVIVKPSASDAASGRPSSRLRLVPREPDVKGGGSGDLIDFIREGPPSAHGVGEHRIPRNVAPFRSTMDSDDLSSLGNFIPSSSTPTGSMTSKSRLSGAPTTGSSNGLAQNGRASGPNVGGGMPPIVRKSRRVKDPYAIDSDDEDDYLTSLPGPSRNQPNEESLADFLRNTEPPKANAPTPVITGVGARQPTTNGTYTNGRAAPSLGGPVRGSNSVSSTTSTSRMPRMKFEPRAAGATKNFGGNGFRYSTNDMADFLRSSGPVEAYTPSPEVPLTKKPSKRGKTFFWQRKSYQV